MGQITTDEFFVKLAELFAARKGKDHGQIYLTQKRITHGQDETDASSPEGDLYPPKPLPIVVRASTGEGKEARSKRVQIATRVDPDAIDAFYARYAEVCKAGMVALKPRDKSKKKAKAKKRKGGAAVTTKS